MSDDDLPYKNIYIYIHLIEHLRMVQLLPVTQLKTTVRRGSS